MILEEHNFSGTAAERFDADGTGAGEKIEEAATWNAFSKDIEERFAEAVAGGAKGQALEAFKLAAAKCSGDDAHGVLDGPQPTRAR